MNNSVPYLQNNEAFNPLYAKMRERFCEGGTIAEKMAVEAGICQKRKTKVSHSEYRITHGNALPSRKESKKHLGFRKAFFNLKNFAAASMALLVLGMLFLSGVSFEGVQARFVTSSNVIKTETHIASEIPELEVGILCFADEALAEFL